MAVPVQTLRGAGLADREIDWLVANTFLTTRPSQPSLRDAQRGGRLKKVTAVSLTETGAAMLEQLCLRGIKPNWNSERRELSVAGQVIKAFRQRSENQELILTAFQEDEWAEQIDDPLPRSPGSGEAEAKARLRKTVEHLNRAQHPWIVSFSVSGNTHRIRWSLRHLPVPDR